MKEEIAKDLCKRFGKLSADRQVVQTVWQAIVEYIQPHRGEFFRGVKSEQSVDWFKNRKIYDSTAVVASRRLAATLHGYLTSPSVRWFGMRFRDDELNEMQAAKEWIQQAMERIYYELLDSNFDLEINKSYQDLVGPGTTVLVLEEAPGSPQQWNGLSFSSIPLAEAFFEEDHNGRCLRFFRKFEWTAGQIITKLGAENVPKRFIEQDEKGSDEKHTLLFCIYPRNNRLAEWGKTLTPKRRPWGSCYLLYDTAEPIGKEGGFYDMPAFVSRWDTTNDSQWGNSPSMDALPDVLSLNQAVFENLRARAKLNDPPLLVGERAGITHLNADPATLTVVRDPSAIAPLETRASLTSQDLTESSLRASIRNIYMMDLLDIPEPQGQPRTATEILEERERRLRSLSATASHTREDLLNPLIERAFNILIRKGQIPEPPQEVLERGGQIDIVYLGALYRSQQMDEVTGIERVLGIAGSMMEAYPRLRFAVDEVEALQQISHKMNTPAGIIRDDKTIQELEEADKEERAKMQEAMVQQEQGKGAEAMARAQQAQGGAA